MTNIGMNYLTVPPVRPLLRRTVKRFLKLLPSVLLLLFVLSLVFVTLMQIAVIHNHRRALAFANINGSSSTDFRVMPTEIRKARLASLNATKNARPVKDQSVSTDKTKGGPNAKKKAEVLRIEALLDRTSPSYEANVKMLQNFVNSARIKEIIAFARGLSTRPVIPQQIATTRNSSNSSDGRSTQTVVDEKNSTAATWASLDEVLTLATAGNKSLCPSVPPRLGKLRLCPNGLPCSVDVQAF